MKLPPGLTAAVLAGVLALSACSTAPDVAPKKPEAQQAQAAKPVAPPASTQQAPSKNAGVLAPNQLIPGVSPNSNAAPSIAVTDQMATRPTPDASGLMRVGLLVPLTGQSAPVGQALLNAAQMALFDIADERFVLQAYDTQGTAEGAVEASNKALAQGVQLLLGPLFSAEVKAVAPLAAAAGVNVVAFSTDPTIAGPHVFVMGFLVHEQVRQIVNYANAKGLKRLAVLAPNSAYGQAAVDAFKQLVPARGGQIAQVAFYQPDGKDLNQVVRQLAAFDSRKQALERQKGELAGKTDEISQLALKRLERQETAGEVDFDAILLPDQGTRLTQAATLLPFFDIDPGRVQLLGTLLWNTPGLGREPVMIGGVFPAPPPESTRQFISRYREFYGQAPPTIATHGYDAVALAAVLARSAAPGAVSVFSSDAITANTGFAGVDGIFRFLPSGLSERGFAVMQVTRDGTTEAQPAPTTFEGAQY